MLAGTLVHRLQAGGCRETCPHHLCVGPGWEKATLCHPHPHPANVWGWSRDFHCPTVGALAQSDGVGRAKGAARTKGGHPAVDSHSGTSTRLLVAPWHHPPLWCPSWCPLTFAKGQLTPGTWVGGSLQGWLHSGCCLGDSHCAFWWWDWTTRDQDRVKTPSSLFTTSSTAWGKSSCFKPSLKLSFEPPFAGTCNSFSAASPRSQCQKALPTQEVTFLNVT